MDVRIHHAWKNEDAFSILFIKSHNANNPIDVCSFRRKTESNELYDCTPKHNPHVNDIRMVNGFTTKNYTVRKTDSCMHALQLGNQIP